jgi:Pectate lyase superfamily protein
VVGGQRFYTSNAVQTTLAASLGSVAAPSTGQTVQLTSISGYPTQFPFTLLLEWGTVNQEVVTVTQAATGGGPFTYANCVRGDDGTTAPAHSSGAAVYHGVSQRDWSQIGPVFNVCDHRYGADNTATVDATTAIQAAINDANAQFGGTVFFPAGAFNISSALTTYPGVYIVGESSDATSIRQTSTTANCFSSVDLYDMQVRNINLKGPGSGSGKGFVSLLSANTNQEHISFCDVQIVNFGGTGLELQNPIASRFERTTCGTNGGHGFYIHGTGSVIGTSCSFVSCYADTNGNIGYWLQVMAYCAFTGCAADANGVGYQIDASQGVSLAGCGAESQLAKNGFDGTSFKITGSNGVTLNAPFTFDQGAVMIWVTGGSDNVHLSGVFESVPHAGATASIKTDAGTMCTIDGYDVTSALSLAANTATVVNDGTTGSARFAGSLSLAQSATAPATATSGTIATAGLGVSRVAPAGAVTSVVLQAGTVAGQTVTVVNESAAANTITFNTTPATAHVADSATEPAIAGLTARSFVWDSGTSLWYRTV